MVSDTVSMRRYPFVAATSARPMPVLSLLGSITVPPGLNVPSLSVASIMESTIRSFTEPLGLSPSSVAHIFGAAVCDHPRNPYERCIADEAQYITNVFFVSNTHVSRMLHTTGNCQG
jgi:hypothetical protein